MVWPRHMLRFRPAVSSPPQGILLTSSRQQITRSFARQRARPPPRFPRQDNERPTATKPDEEVVRRFRPATRPEPVVARSSTSLDTSTASSTNNNTKNKTQKNSFPPKTTNKRKMDFRSTYLTQDAAHHDDVMFARHVRKVVVTCQPGLEQVVSKELTWLGLEHEIVPPPSRPPKPSANHNKNKSSSGKKRSDWLPTTSGRIVLTKNKKKSSSNGFQEDHYQPLTWTQLVKCHLYLGAATKIQCLLFEDSFQSRALGELKRKISVLPWHAILNFDLPNQKKKQQQEAKDLNVSIFHNPKKTNKQQQQQQQQQHYRGRGENHWDEPPPPPPEPEYHTETVYCRIKASSSQSRLFHTGAIQQRVLEGINLALVNRRLKEQHPSNGNPAKQPNPQSPPPQKERRNQPIPTIPQLALPSMAPSNAADTLSGRSDFDDDDEFTRFDSESNVVDTTTSTPEESSNKQQSSSDIQLSLDVRVRENGVQLWLDTTLTPLHQRGYRLATGKAPLREDLAYAMLYNVGWIPNYYRYSPPKEQEGQALSKQQQPSKASHQFTGFLDPFCGSGTLAIEAASMYAGLLPGRLRTQPPMNGTIWCNDQLWNKLLRSYEKARLKEQRQKEEDESQTLATTSIPIACSDRNAGAMDLVRGNATRAGVWDMLTVTHCAVSAHPWFQTTVADPTASKASIDKMETHTENKNEDSSIDQMDIDNANTNQEMEDKEENTTEKLGSSIDQIENDNDNDKQEMEDKEENTTEKLGSSIDQIENDNDNDKQEMEDKEENTTEKLTQYVDNFKQDKGLLIATNAPFGKRLSTRSSKNSKPGKKSRYIPELLPLFQTFASCLSHLDKNNSFYTAAVLTNDENVFKRSCSIVASEGVKTNLQFSHGGIRASSLVVSNVEVSSSADGHATDSVPNVSESSGVLIGVEGNTGVKRLDAE